MDRVLIRENDLYHHGIKGMHWGIRRYQNYDGSYTKKGVERYRKAENSYNNAVNKLQETKASYKAGNSTKQSVRRAKSDVKYRKRELSKSYDKLREDKKADQGKELYRRGHTITNDSGVTAGLVTASGFGVSASRMLADMGYSKASVAVLGSSVGLGAVAVGKDIVDKNRATKLRAYYGHHS